MTDKELRKLLSGVQYIPHEGERDELTQIILKAASESLTLKKLKKITIPAGNEELLEDVSKIGQRGFVKFTKKEINKMPERYQKIFILSNRTLFTRRA